MSNLADKSNLNRRDFIGTSLIAGLGAAAGSIHAAVPSQTKPAAVGYQFPYNERTYKAMPMRNLGKTGFRVGIVSLGCQAAIEIKGNEKLSVDIMNRALDLGVNYFDTSHVYGGGVSEEHVGLVMKDRRKEVFLASKTAVRDRDTALKQLDISLKRLQTDHLDLWQVHNIQKQKEVDQLFSDNGAIKAFEEARADGRVKFLGITGHYEPMVLAEALKRYSFDCILMAVNAADRHYLSFIEHLLPVALEQQMGVIGMKVATRGRMLSTWTPPALEEQPERMRTVKPGTITMKESLYYNMSLPLSTNIVGVDDVKQMEELVAWASEFNPLNESQMAQIEQRTLPIVRQALYFRRWDMGA